MANDGGFIDCSSVLFESTKTWNCEPYLEPFKVWAEIFEKGEDIHGCKDVSAFKG